jgi:transcriptional regulator with XRE-family HTH domain
MMKETLSQYVQRIMKQKDLGLTDIERNCNKEMTASYIGKVASGSVTNLSVEKIVALAKGLDVDPYEIFAVSYGVPPGDPHRPDAYVLIDIMQKLLADPELMEAVNYLVNLSVEQRKVFAKFIERIAKKKTKSKKKNT